MQIKKFDSVSAFNEKMQLTKINDDSDNTLGHVYDNSYPHPVFDPKKICFRMLRNADHRKFNDRKTVTKDVAVVWEDWEPYTPGIGDIHHSLEEKVDGTYPVRDKDFVITNCITNQDNKWPVPYVYNNYHFVQTHHANHLSQFNFPDNRQYTADILFGNSKPHRKMFFDLLARNGMLESNIINLFHTYRSNFLDSVNDQMQSMVDAQLNNDYPNTTLFLKDNFVSQHISGTIMENSWYSVVGETIYDNDCFFVTEKTAKPMMAGRPFIMLGGKHYLKHLRGLGFKTFEPVIDESYDDIDQWDQRIKSAFESFQALSTQNPITVYTKLKTVLDHNQRIMYDKHQLTKKARSFLDELHTKYAYDPKTKH